MPVMDGIEATHEILDYEKDEGLKHVPIVALTANALKGDRERFLGEGMDEYITKPIETTELLYILNKFLARSSNTETNESSVTKTEVESPTEAVPENETIEEIAPNLHEDTEKELVLVDDLIMQEPEITIDNIVQKEKKILIAKKFLLSRRILAKVLENLGYDYDVLEDLSTLDDALTTKEYDILFTDVKLISSTLSDLDENIAIISSCDTNNPQEVQVTKGETITSNASKEEINNLINKYRG